MPWSSRNPAKLVLPTNFSLSVTGKILLSVTKAKIFGVFMTPFFSHTSSPDPLGNPHSSVSDITRIQLPLITPSSLAQATAITHLDYCKQPPNWSHFAIFTLSHSPATTSLLPHTVKVIPFKYIHSHAKHPTVAPHSLQEKPKSHSDLQGPIWSDSLFSLILSHLLDQGPGLLALFCASDTGML